MQKKFRLYIAKFLYSVTDTFSIQTLVEKDTLWVGWLINLKLFEIVFKLDSIY